MKSWSIRAPAVFAQCVTVFSSGSSGPKSPVAVTQTVIVPRPTWPVPALAHTGPGHETAGATTDPPALDDGEQ
jgi:hypothetical protein